jgi:hypothetical protein
MRHRVQCIGFASLFFCTLTLSSSVSFTTNRYIEDFTTRQHCDTLNTTANWDTTAGELKLPWFAPTLVGNYTNGVEDVAVAGDYAFVARGWDGLMIIDISDPTNPTLAGSVSTPGSGISYAVALSGDHAYIAAYSEGLVVCDISNPASPSVAGSYDTPGSAYYISISGDYAYVADVNAGLQVIDIGSPDTPSLAGTYNTPGDARGLCLAGEYAYVADAASGLQVIDITDPTTPSLAGGYDTPGDAWNVFVAGDYAYLTDRYSGLQVIDIADPTTPFLAGSYDSPGDARGLTVDGDFLYMADYGEGLQVIDIKDPLNPDYMYGYDTPGSAREVVVWGEYAYVADRSGGLRIVDVNNRTDLAYIDSFNTPGEAYHSAVSGNYLYVADDSEGLQVIDISDPLNVFLAGGLDVTHWLRNVVVSGNYVYAASSQYGLEVFSITNPAIPSRAGGYSATATKWVAVAGDKAYLAVGGLIALDISDPASPALLGECVTPIVTYCVEVSGDHAYSAARFDGLYVFDISDPTNPTVAGSYDTPGASTELAISGDYVYIADGDTELQVINITDPTNPTLVGSYTDLNVVSEGIAISGSLAYLATSGWPGIIVFDISNPASPAFVDNYQLPADAYGVTLDGDYAYVATGAVGINVLDARERGLNQTMNQGQSLAFATPVSNIVAVKTTTSHTDSISWELSTNGTSWTSLKADGKWQSKSLSGTSLMWRSTHTYMVGGDNPTASNLDIQWLYDHASIDSIVDVPDDQGGWVRIFFESSGYDGEEVGIPLSYYGIWQRVDGFQGAAAVAGASHGETGGFPILVRNGRKFVDTQSPAAAAEFPPGQWEWVATVPALQEDHYVARVPTVVDSMVSGINYSVYVITAHRSDPSLWYVGLPDSGYSVDNIAPGVPQGFSVAYNSGSNLLQWQKSPEEDFQHYVIYRSTEPDFDPDPGNLAHATADEQWLDPVAEGWRYHYKITAVDHAGNESEATGPETATGATETEVPQSFALHQNVPNPFNPTTTIAFDLPKRASVRLAIYDVSGQMICMLVDAEMAPGRKSVRWDGMDATGRKVASGVYFYRLQTPAFGQSKKMILLR